MKSVMTKLFSVISFALVFLICQSCVKDTCKGEYTYMKQVPVYKKVSEIRQVIKVLGGRELCNPGKLFVYGDYIFVNELRKGIHIIDNAYPESPSPIAFIDIPGNVDIAVKDNILYADNYIDLVYLDIERPMSPVYKGRVEDVFNNFSFKADLGHLVYYDLEEVTVEYDCEEGDRFGEANFDVDFFDGNSILPFSEVATGLQAVAGSLSRFANFGNYLYVIDNSAIDIFNIENRCFPVYTNEVQVEWGIETLFPVGANLFIGANNGVHIYSLDDPTQPAYRSKFEHARSCDPVFVQDQTAYVTLRDGRECFGFINQLDVLDVKDIQAPILIASVTMENPHGLSISDDLLLLCEGEYGFKIFDKSDPKNIANNELSHVEDIHAYDVIALPGTQVALVVGEDGLYQFDFSNAQKPFLVSKLDASRDCE